MTAQADIDFESELWKSAVQLRGTVSPADYKNYVLPLLFVRYLSLRYEQTYRQLQMELKDPQGAYGELPAEAVADLLNDPTLFTAKGVFVIPDEARWKYLRDSARADDIKLRVDTAMRLLEESHPKLRGVLPRNLYANSNLTNDQMAGLINLFSKEKFAQENGADLLGRTYEYFISNFASTEGNRGGEFFTASSVVKLLVAMLQPYAGRVFDPACGSGGMFIQSAAMFNNRKLSFYGQELNESTLRLCKMNLILHGLDGEIRLGNSLLSDKFPDLKADVVIANPPFNMRDWNASEIKTDKDERLKIGYRKGELTNGNANYMWMMHFLYHLADGGTAGYVMANGAMTTNTEQEKNTRQALVEEGYVDAIVQLPDKLFFGTGIPVTLWFLSKNRRGTHAYRSRRDEILFIDARKLGMMVTRRQRALSDDEINRIAETYHRYRKPGDPIPAIAGFCRVATLEEVRGHEYKLTPGIYVGTATDEDEDEPFAEKMPRLVEELRGLFAESNRLQKEILADLEELTD
jgi:type I restriction enzyme M protein